VRCADVTDQLLLEQLGATPELDRHVAECASCAHVARGLRHLDVVLSSAFVVAPPIELQHQLTQLALEAARAPKPVPWRTRASDALNHWDWNPAAWLAQPQMVAAQGLAAVLLALASWQIFGWVTTFQPVVGDVAYALELVIASPAAVYMGGLQIDLQSLGLWSVVGIVGWLVSEDGLIGRRFSNRQRLP
jgi:hypothetical protein